MSVASRRSGPGRKAALVATSVLVSLCVAAAVLRPSIQPPSRVPLVVATGEPVTTDVCRTTVIARGWSCCTKGGGLPTAPWEAVRAPDGCAAAAATTAAKRTAVVGNLPLPVLSVEAVSSGGTGLRVGRVTGLLNPAQCASVMEAARRRGLRRSGVGDGGARSHVRTSQGVFLLDDGGTAGVGGGAQANTRLRERAAALLGLPSTEYFEPTHVLKYRPGERYLPHRDTITSEAGLRAGGQRFASLVVSLNTPPATAGSGGGGGGTRFPRVPGEGAGNLTLRPEAGGAVLFYLERKRAQSTASSHGVMKEEEEGSLLQLEPEPDALHEGLPTSGWNRFVAVLWAHHHPYVLPDDDGDVAEGATRLDS